MLREEDNAALVSLSFLFWGSVICSRCINDDKKKMRRSKAVLRIS